MAWAEIGRPFRAEGPGLLFPPQDRGGIAAGGAPGGLAGGQHGDQDQHDSSGDSRQRIARGNAIELRLKETRQSRGGQAARDNPGQRGEKRAAQQQRDDVVALAMPKSSTFTWPL